MTNRFFSKELAGGALLDIGVYATSFARFFMKSKPDTILTTANYFETGVDETSGTVSYTHLDVYKRQQFLSLFIRERFVSALEHYHRVR